MLYKGKTIELLGVKEVLGEKVAWIRLTEDNTFQQVAYEELQSEESLYSMAFIRFVALAAKIKDEVAKKNILSPYESSLIPLPHQILVLERVIQSNQNRFLLADEVGMGKTIEAGLILKELKLRGEVKRILAIVPKSAMMQWQSELKEHFNEVFHLYDSELINALTRTFSNLKVDREFNFWGQHDQIIVSTDALKPIVNRRGWTKEHIEKYNKYRIEAVLNANFDLVIIDEAHKVGGSSSTVSRFKLAQALCNAVPSVLLLTATPHRGKADHFRRILQLLDTNAFAGEGLPGIEELENYVIRTEKRFAVNYEGEKLFNERETILFNIELNPEKHKKQIALYESVTHYVRKGFNTAKRTNNTATGLIMILFQRLASSSTSAILTALQGRLERLQTEGENSIEDFSNEIDTIEDYMDAFSIENGNHYSNDFMQDETGLLEKLIENAKECLNNETDAKTEALLDKYRELQQFYDNRDLKIIVFTEFRSTQKMLEAFFDLKGYRTEIINGSQTLIERKSALGKFKNQAQILIATDAAGESLNMQFAYVVFNYDLPWNPMVIEQRIGRVDRIGQQEKVKAFNMLTNNSVDKRVYEIIEIKLSNILNQLGIDKTSDVLDSTMDMKEINQLYLSSLLDPSHFEFSAESWLYNIKMKLKEFQSTKQILPQVRPEEIEPKKASDIKYSPISSWLERLMLARTQLHKGRMVKDLMGNIEIEVNNEVKKIAFDAETALNNPDIEHITLQHDWIKGILNGLSEFTNNNGLPVIQSLKGDETPGYWSIWEISAVNRHERKTAYFSYFVTTSGKIYTAYANDIWNRFISEKDDFEFTGIQKTETDTMLQALQNALLTAFQNLEVEVSEIMATKLKNKLKAYEFQKARINKIGIKNIREAKLKKLNREHERWLEEFYSDKKIIPHTKLLLNIKIDG